MNDYVGASRFQWPDEQIRVANDIRGSLPLSVFVQPDGANFWPIARTRPDLQSMMGNDPSEAADSDAIIASVRKYFPDAEILPIGAMVLNLVLTDIIYNIPDDSAIMTMLVRLDERLADMGEYHHAAALAFK